MAPRFYLTKWIFGYYLCSLLLLDALQSKIEDTTHHGIDILVTPTRA
jgi:hypothetical protein